MNAFYHGTFVQDLRKKAARLVAAKCTLAARIDSFHENSVETSGKSEFFICHMYHCALLMMYHYAVVLEGMHI